MKRLYPGDLFQVGTLLEDGTTFWGRIQTVRGISSDGRPVYRPKWAKVDKCPDLWRTLEEKDIAENGMKLNPDHTCYDCGMRNIWRDCCKEKTTIKKDIDWCKEVCQRETECLYWN